MKATLGTLPRILSINPSSGLPSPYNPMPVFHLKFFVFSFLTAQTPDQVSYPNSMLKSALEYHSPSVRGQPRSSAAIEPKEVRMAHATETTLGLELCTYVLEVRGRVCMSREKSIDSTEARKHLVPLLLIFLAIYCWYRLILHVACVEGGGHVRLRARSGVRPNTSAHVSRAGGEVVSSGARGHGNNAVLVALQHDLSVSGSGVPELHPSVLGS